MIPDDGFRLDDFAEQMGRLASHPSYFTLASFASGNPMPLVGNHVAGCEVCQAIVEALALPGGAGRAKADRLFIERA